MRIPVKIVNKGTNKNPEYKTSGSSGMDLRADIYSPIDLLPGEITIISTGISLCIPKGYEGQVRSRSSVSSQRGLAIVGGLGTIDSDYRGEIKIPIINLSSTTQTITVGERIAQLVIAPIVQADLIPVESLDVTERGDGGFGSTGKN